MDATIRPATLEDKTEVVRMGMLFGASTAIGQVSAPKANIIAVTFETFVQWDGGAVFVVELPGRTTLGGMVVVGAAPSLFNAAIEAHELCLWVEPELRGYGFDRQLLKVSEDWACVKGMTLLKMGVPYGSRWVNRLTRLGYEPVEVGFVKRLDAHVTVQQVDTDSEHGSE